MSSLSEPTQQWIMAQGFNPDALDAGIEITHPDNERWKNLTNTQTLMQEREGRKGQPVDWDVADIPEEYTPPPTVISKYDLPAYEMADIEEELEAETPPLEVVVNNTEGEIAQAAKTDGVAASEASEPEAAGAGTTSTRSHAERVRESSNKTSRLLEAGAGIATAVVAYKSLDSLQKDEAAKKDNGEEPTWQSRVKKGAICFAAVTGVAFAADAVMGGHMLKAIMSKVKTGSWQSRL